MGKKMEGDDQARSEDTQENSSDVNGRSGHLEEFLVGISCCAGQEQNNYSLKFYNNALE